MTSTPAISDRTSSRAHPVLANVALAASGCLWGTGFLFGKIAMREANVTENVTFRFVIGSLALIPILVRRWQPYSRRDLVHVALTALLGVPIQFLVQFKGLQLTTVSHASLMVGLLPMLLAVSSAIFLHERLRSLEWMLLAAASAGGVFIALSRETSAAGPQASVAGDLLVVLSMVLAVVMVLSTKSLIARYDSLHVTALMLAMGTVMLAVWLCATQPVRLHFSTATWSAMAAQGLLATAAAFIFWNWGLKQVPASRAGVFLNLEPVLGAALGVAILGERLGPLALVGGAIICASAYYFSAHPHEAPVQNE